MDQAIHRVLVDHKTVHKHLENTHKAALSAHFLSPYFNKTIFLHQKRKEKKTHVKKTLVESKSWGGCKYILHFECPPHYIQAYV